VLVSICTKDKGKNRAYLWEIACAVADQQASLAAAAITHNDQLF